MLGKYKDFSISDYPAQIRPLARIWDHWNIIRLLLLNTSRAFEASDNDS